ncbi:MAG: tetratricopeptide repeat protein [Planctomycetota bacterium]
MLPASVNADPPSDAEAKRALELAEEMAAKVAAAKAKEADAMRQLQRQELELAKLLEAQRAAELELTEKARVLMEKRQLLQDEARAMKERAGQSIVDKPTSPNGALQEAAIRETVAQLFDLRYDAQAARIVGLKAELEALEQQLAKRKQNRDAIIDQRVIKLLGQASTKVAGDSPVVDEDPEKLSREGWRLWRNRDLPASIEKFKSAVQLDPKNANSWNGLGWACLNSGLPEDAEKCFAKAVALEPDHLAALNGVGQVMRAFGKSKEAIKALEKATQAVIDKVGEERTVKNGMTASWISLIQVLVDEKQYDEARDWIKRYQRYDAKNEMVAELAESIPEAS